MKLTTITFLLLALTSTKTFACGNGECDPEPEPPQVERPTPEREGNKSSVSGVYYSVCTCDKMKVAWGFESLEVRTAKARSQCEIRRTEKLECPEKWK